MPRAPKESRKIAPAKKIPMLIRVSPKHKDAIRRIGLADKRSDAFVVAEMIEHCLSLPAWPPAEERSDR